MLKGTLTRRDRDDLLDKGEAVIRALAADAKPDDPEGQQAIVDKWLQPRKGAGRPKKLQKQMLLILALQLAGATNEEVAKAIGLGSASDVSRIKYRAKRDFAALDMGINSRKLRALDMAMDNLVDGLGAGEAERRDKFTLETLKGLGEFRSHSAVKQEGQAGLSALVVQIRMPELPEGQTAVATAGTIVGVPRRAVLEGEVVKDA